MPLVFKLETGAGRVFGVWRADEPEDWFSNHFDLHPEEAEELSRISNVKKRLQWLAARAGLRFSLPDLAGLPVLKNERNAPFLPHSDVSISLSHSGAYAAFAANLGGIAAVDLEAARQKKRTAAARMFMSPEEQELLKKCNDVDYFLGVWCAKECMFKAINYKHQQISFQREFKTSLKPEALAQPRGAFSGSFQRADAEIRFELEFLKTENWLACLLFQ